MTTLKEPQALNKIDIRSLKGVGEKTALALSALGLNSVEDLLFHLPFRYEDRTRIYPLADIREGMSITVEGVVSEVRVMFGKRRSLNVNISDGQVELQCRFFHFSAAQKARFVVGEKLRCFGEVRFFNRQYCMIHPEYTHIEPGKVIPMAETLTPVYSVTDGVKQAGMRKLCTQALGYLKQMPPAELLPPKVLANIAPWTLGDALQFLHAPTPEVTQALLDSGEHPALQRLILEELCAYFLGMREMKEAQAAKPAPVFIEHNLQERLLNQLPFQPTAAQARVVAEINADLATSSPMHRLVQGDVGSGKTLVAALAALAAIEAKKQAAIMAPTEILAEQHYEWFSEQFAALDIRVDLLTSKMPAKAKRSVLENIALGLSQLVIGTHALFQEQVNFKALGLLIIDEQHRFGVHQRLALKMKGNVEDLEAHQLIMTATPIPRTLSMTSFANLDQSIIDELPPGRQAIGTAVIPDTRRDEVVQKIQGAVHQGRQVYWVCTLIEESELIQCQAAENTRSLLAEQLEGVRVGLVHGRMKGEEKAGVMQQFKAGELDVLVATTVIEVGVNVPNASLMVIENPERLGLAQLHQLRGRVGRGDIESHCLLMYHGPLSKNAKARLQAMRETTDGFVLAEKDLEIRGPGEILGTRQTGLVQFKVADLTRDQELLVKAQQIANQVFKAYPQLVKALIRRWLGQKTRYSDV